MNWQSTRKQSLRDMDELTRAGVLEARAATARLVAHVTRNGLGKPGDLGRQVRKIASHVVGQAGAAGYLTGYRRHKLIAAPIKLSTFDDVIAAAGKLSPANVALIQKKFMTRALQATDDLGSDLEEAVRESIAKSLVEGKHVKAGAQALAELVQLEQYQLETMFRTQTMFAYNAGKWQADGDLGIVAGYRYSSVHDARVRDNHEAGDKVQLPRDHEFWQQFWPPNGYNCRCIVIPLFSEPDGGWDEEPPAAAIADEGFGFNLGSELSVLD